MPKTLPASALMPPDHVEASLRILRDHMPGDSVRARGPKQSRDPFRSCISCMLSAQSLDRNTAKATQALFQLARTPQDMLALSNEEIVDAIRPAGLYNRKAGNIRRFCEQLLVEHDGIVPDTRDGLLELHGIGRKCADLIAHFAFGRPHIAVDTHIRRVCQRSGLAMGKTEAQVAASLDDRAPEWAKPDAHFWLLQFGKRVCRSRTPLCPDCPIRPFCRYPAKTDPAVVRP
ncbi:endonuclease III [uncultured Algimonas sp.]|uniref:endonuclease III domain-containing protein n=1 Tax=uncultured Algimonas sp. TaxID=1547920 RepID=UPI0026071EBE|nr:endonuclease III [uncultured Algimonas sp.]